MKWNEIFQIIILKSIHWKNIIKKNNVIIKPCSPSAPLPLYLSHTTKTLPPPPPYFLSTNTTFFEHYTSWEKPKGKSQIDDYVGSIQTHPVTVAASLLQT